jgi:PD-(D/E)XK nuclease superfamily
MSAPTLRKSFDANGIQFAFDSTSLKLFQECPRKYQYKMLEGWTRREKSVHLLFGGWYATALEHYYKHIALGMTSDEALHAVVTDALISTWVYDLTEDGQPIQGTGAPWTSDHNTKTRENLIRTIVWYVGQFGEEDISVITTAEGKPAVEYSFSLPVDNGIVLSGHIDRLVEYAGHPYVMDQKTTGSTITPYYFDQFNPDMQMSLYTFAGRMIYNMPVKGVIIDAAQIAVGFTRFARGFTFRSDQMLNEWYDETMELALTIRQATKNDMFPRNSTACGNFGGCEFRSICSRSPEIREQFLKGDFIQGKLWDPLEAR